MRAALMLLIGSLAYSAQSFCLTTSAPAGVPASLPSAMLASLSPFTAQAQWAIQAVHLAKSRSSSRSSSARRSSRASTVHSPSRTSSKNTRSSNCTSQSPETSRLANGQAAGDMRAFNTVDREPCTPSRLDDLSDTAAGF